MNSNSKAIAGGHPLITRTIANPDERALATESRTFEKSFEIPSYTGYIAPTVDKIVRAIRKARCIPGKESDIQGALFEALANAVIHGNRSDAKKQVHVECRFIPQKCMCIVVRDEGAGFDPKAVPDPTRPEGLASDHGRGILLMRAFMDEVHFEKNGTEVRLIKHCDGPVQTLLKSYSSRISDYVRRHRRKKK